MMFGTGCCWRVGFDSGLQPFDVAYFAALRVPAAELARSTFWWFRWPTRSGYHWKID